jgi:hypothetical protein
MAEYGEWNRKGATLSDVTAKKEYGIDQDFIVKGIRAGKLEYRQGVMWGNPYFRLLRSQIEQYIAEELGKDRLSSLKSQTELRRIKKEIVILKKRLNELQTLKIGIEEKMGKEGAEHAADKGSQKELRTPKLRRSVNKSFI